MDPTTATPGTASSDGPVSVPEDSPSEPKDPKTGATRRRRGRKGKSRKTRKGKGRRRY